MSIYMVDIALGVPTLGKTHHPFRRKA